MTAPDRPVPLGATPDASGTHFAVYSSVASRVELCLFAADGTQTRIVDMHGSTDSVWRAHVANCGAGQRYGYRVHGAFDPEQGLRCNPAKLLLDPYARALSGRFAWNAAVFDHLPADSVASARINTADSAPHVPKSVVCDALPALPAGPQRPWSESIFYEANVRGYTMLHPAVAADERGTFDGMRNRDVLAYLKALGVTAIELMPVHAFIDEQHLAVQGLRNFWGYNTISFFALHNDYSRTDPVAEFRDMVRAVHEAGMELILDVVYNHTAEGGHPGPTLSLRGLDNLAYYSVEPGAPGTYVNDTGCGNTLCADSPQLQQLVLESLRYWHRDMGVDGFRFDLAPVLGRHNHGYSPGHPLLDLISNDATLRGAKLVAEPWDPGPGGYQLGNFPPRWAEWNDRYRDSVRRYWRGDHGVSGALANSIRGSADLFDRDGRSPAASVNLVTSHDGYTLADTVSYEQRHNEANGENNRDGHRHNFSCNHGVEGATDDAAILNLRRQQRLNLMATLLLSQGTPLLLAGDEFGNSQSGNNNAYAQDNATGWLSWDELATDPDFTAQVRELIWLRRETPLLRLPDYLHGNLQIGGSSIAINWFNADGRSMQDHDWATADALGMLVHASRKDDADAALAILINRSGATRTFDLPPLEAALAWRLAFASAADASVDGLSVALPALCITLLLANPPNAR